MASRGQISALALAEVGAGVILAWSGITNAPLAATFTSLIKGQKPAQGPPGQTGTVDTGSPAATSAPAGGSAAYTGGPGTVSASAAYTALRNAGFSAATAVIMVAIGYAESGLRTGALNNDPATGDYSVGVWQINYYGPLMASRTAQFGAPSALLGNLQAQANAAHAVYTEQGLAAWSTYTSGAYSGFLLQAQNAANAP